MTYKTSAASKVFVNRISPEVLCPLSAHFVPLLIAAKMLKIELPTPAFSGPPSKLTKWSGISVIQKISVAASSI